ncbi:hypothetical protein KKA95_01470 [Patescibacteria group bacterium]|nr:hypothetical protein [Patescibacteria group bacterium]
MVKNTPSYQGDIERRSFIKLALGVPMLAAACREELTGAFSVKTKPDTEITVKVPEAEKPPECKEWECQVDLPKIDFNEDSEPWTPEKIREYLIPETTDQEKFQRFYGVFDELKESLLSKIAETKSFRKQKKLTNKFLTELRTALEGDDKKDVDNTEWPMGDFNRHLIPHGFFLDIKWDSDNINRVYKCTLYKTEESKSLTASDDLHSSELPVITVAKHQELLSKSNIISSDLSDFNAAYISEGHYILVDKNSLDSTSETESFIEKMEEIDNAFEEHKEYDKDSETIASKLKRQFILHEGMHAIFAQNIDEESISPEVIREKGTIDMGSFELDTNKIPKEFLDFQNLTELSAIGYQLMNSEDTASLIAANHLIAFGKPSSYKLAEYVLQHLVWYSPHITDDFREEYSEYKFGEFAACFRSGLIIPNEELYRIGEVMAKLGIYLTQE